jgi:hypothetical protein
MAQRKNRFRLAVVLWEDSHGGDTPWVPPEALPKAGLPMISVGLLVHKTKEVVTLALSRTMLDEDICAAGAYITIPRAMIRHIAVHDTKELL